LALGFKHSDEGIVHLTVPLPTLLAVFLISEFRDESIVDSSVVNGEGNGEF
jgi:hypothetical protein